MNMKHLHTFLILSETCNFTKAASTLHYAQSNVTSQIQQLEAELNVSLFNRIGKSVSLTAAGEHLIPYARQILSLADEATVRISDSVSYPIVIGASESVCLGYLPTLIRNFHADHPQLPIELKVLDVPDFLPALAHNEIQLAYAIGPAYSAPHLEIQKQKAETVGLYVIPEHPLARRKKLSAHELADQSFLLTSPVCFYRRQFEHDLQSQGITPQIALQTGSIQVIKEAALLGLGIALLPACVVSKELSMGKLIALDYTNTYSLYSTIMYHKDQWLSKEFKQLLQYLS